MFVEVKARRRSRFGVAEEALTAAKRARPMRLAAAHLGRIGTRGATLRSELAALRLGAGGDIEAVQVIPSD